jgi:hypothetical protein
VGRGLVKLTKPLGAASLQAGESRDSSGSESDGLRRFLDSLQEKLIGEFDALADKQRRIPPDEFNDDDKYKQHLNEVLQTRTAPHRENEKVKSRLCAQALDAKNKLLNKHRAILAMRSEPSLPFPSLPFQRGLAAPVCSTASQHPHVTLARTMARTPPAPDVKWPQDGGSGRASSGELPARPLH